MDRGFDVRTYGTLEYDKERNVFEIETEPHVMIRLKRMFPRIRTWARGSIWMKATDDVVRDLVWFMMRWPLVMDAATERHVTERHAAVLESEERILSIMGGAVTDRGLQELARPSRDYQQIATDIMIETGRLLLGDDLGLGKSHSAAAALADPRFLPSLVVCPTHLPKQWQREINTILPWLHTHIVTKSEPYNIPKRMHGHEPDVIIINYAKLRGWGFDLKEKVRSVIFDEVQDLRREGSDKYRAAQMVAHRADLKVGMSATPIYNYGGEMFNIMDILAPDVLGDRDEFAREWCTGSGTKQKVNDPVAFGMFLREQGVFLRRTRSEVGRELPAVTTITHVVDCDAETLDDLTGDEAIRLAESILSTDNKPFDRMQAASDFDWRLRHATGVAKARYVAGFTRMILETEEPVLLLAWHHDVYDIFRKLLEDHRPAWFTGRETGKQKQDAAEAFIKGDTNLLIMSLRAAAGLDGLQERCSVAVFGELDWAPGMHDQAIGRLNRDGQKSPVLAYFLHTEDGSDPVVMEALNLKRMQSEPIRDPSLPFFQPHVDGTDRMKTLALEYLKRKGRR